jgi:transcriptional regulator with XRE-family HTH domain
MAAKEELREFLRSRRARITPTDVGLAVDDGPRRVPGLRREEIARLAGVSVDYYTRLEQGRDINVSEHVLRAVAEALRLDPDERDHLFNLAWPSRAPRKPDPAPDETVRAGIRELLDTVSTPAFVLGCRLDVLASNRMARALLTDFDALPRRERNHARWVFLDPVARERYVEWEQIARDNVAMLRMHAGRFRGDRELTALLAELKAKSPAFAALWAEHDVLSQSHGVKRYRHPLIGEVTLRYEALPIPDVCTQLLYVYTAEPGSSSERALRLLSSWTLPTPGRDDAQPATP